MSFVFTTCRSRTKHHLQVVKKYLLEKMSLEESDFGSESKLAFGALKY